MKRPGPIEDSPSFDVETFGKITLLLRAQAVARSAFAIFRRWQWKREAANSLHVGMEREEHEQQSSAKARPQGLLMAPWS